MTVFRRKVPVNSIVLPDGFKELFELIDCNLFNEYIYNKKIGLLQKFKHCPHFKTQEAKEKLEQLLGSIPNEKKSS